MRGKRLKDESGKTVLLKKLHPEIRKLVRRNPWSPITIPLRKKTTREFVMPNTGLIVNIPINPKKGPKPKKKAPVQGMPITIDNFFVNTFGEFEEIESVPDGFTLFFRSRGSRYYTGQNKDVLVRVSDHWGWGIRFCNWYLKGFAKKHCGGWKNLCPDRTTRIGKIHYSDMKPNQ
ncbi:MAG TPA: hypothetical protein VFM69_06335 [Pricia sp.]|nr:hypothetical protein [Pricia sp.]